MIEDMCPNLNVDNFDGTTLQSLNYEIAGFISQKSLLYILYFMDLLDGKGFATRA